MRHGVNTAFGIVGGEASALRFDEVDGFRFFLTRHEFAAGIMADVYARLTGRPQMCYSTFGPGLTNMATGVCSAVLDRSPILAVAAQIVRSERVFNQTHQCIDNVAVMAPMCKFAHELDSVEEIPAIVSAALTASRRDVPGPSFISFPLDLMKAEIADQRANRLLANMPSSDPPPPPAPEVEQLRALAAQLASARRPMALGGNAIIREGATAPLLQFLEAWDIPLITTFASKGLIPESHRLLIGSVNKYLDGIMEYPALDEVFGQCDLMLLIGYDFGEDVKPVQWQRNPDIRNIAIGPHENPMGDVFQPESEVICSLRTGLSILAEMAPKGRVSADVAAIARLKERKRNTGVAALDGSGGLPVPAIIRTIREQLGPSGILCSDIGLHKQYAGLFSDTFEPNTFLCSNGAGTFGFGLPAAMAARLAHPDRPVGLICGDGGFHSTSQDLETARRYGLPFVIVLLKDNSYGLIKYYQLTDKDDVFRGSVDFGNVDFVKLAEANGWAGQQVHGLAELRAVMSQAVRDNRYLLIEIPIEYQYRFAAPTGGSVPD